MLDFLFRRLTNASPKATKLFDTITRLAREPHWYLEGKIPDSLDGRFAVLATVTALVLVRLEKEARVGDRISVALTERFIEVMESEHRELGLGDPSLGKTVRKLVGSLARRTKLWRSVVNENVDWMQATRSSLYNASAAPEAPDHSETALRRLWASLVAADVENIEQGEVR